MTLVTLVPLVLGLVLKKPIVVHRKPIAQGNYGTVFAGLPRV